MVGRYKRLNERNYNVWSKRWYYHLHHHIDTNFQRPVKSIPLTQGQYTVVDDGDYEYLSQFKWLHKGGYAARQVWDKELKKYYWEYMHRVVNRTPKGLLVDHINRDSLDNRRHNLKSCNRSENNRNRAAYGKSGVKGVSKIGKKWYAQITINKKHVSLGYFNNINQAVAAFSQAADGR